MTARVAGVAVHELTPSADGAGPGGPSSDVPVVLAVHGITANALSWKPLARALDGRARVLAPDLRGRADSRTVGPEYGIDRHAEDLVEVLDGAGVGRAVVVGHSMGAFVTAVLAARHPERVAAAVLVDGGLAFPPPPDQDPADVDALLQAVIGPAMARLSMTFESQQAYLDFWSVHPALGPALTGPAGDDVRAYLLHDLVEGDDGLLRSSCVLDAVRVDGAQVLLDTDVHASARAAVAQGVPMSVLWARRGLMDEPQGLYDEARLAALDLPSALTLRAVDDCNHYSVVLDPRAVAVVAGTVSDHLH